MILSPDKADVPLSDDEQESLSVIGDKSEANLHSVDQSEVEQSSHDTTSDQSESVGDKSSADDNSIIEELLPSESAGLPEREHLVSSCIYGIKRDPYSVYFLSGLAGFYRILKYFNVLQEGWAQPLQPLQSLN